MKNPFERIVGLKGVWKPDGATEDAPQADGLSARRLIPICLGGVFAAVFAAFGADEATVRSSTLRLALDRRGRMTGLRTMAGAELLNPAAPALLFFLEATRTDDYTVTRFVDAGKAKQVEVTPVPGGADAVFSAFPTNAPAERVTCRIRGRTDDPRLRFTASVQLRAGWALTQLAYPQFTAAPKIGEKAEDDAFANGNVSNVLMRNPAGPDWSPWYRGTFPGGMATQFVTFYDDAAGFVFAAEDPDGLAKTFAYNRDKNGYRYWLVSRCYEPGTAERPYEVTLVGLAGTPENPLTWHDGADVYRTWAAQQKWCRTSIAERKDLPAWMKDAPAMTMFHPHWFEHPERIHRWINEYWAKSFADTPLLASMWGWERHGMWVGTDYFPCHPSDETFCAITRDMRAHGIHPYPWPSGYFWTLTYDKRPDGTFAFDDRARFAQIGERHAICSRDGKTLLRPLSWLKGGEAAELCGGDPWTVPWVSENIVRALAKRGCDVLHGDQINGGAFADCWCRAHPHAPGAGLWKVEAARAQLVSARAALDAEMPAGGVVSYEEPNETLDDLSGIQLVRARRHGPKTAETANLYVYVNHGAIPLYTANPPRNFDVMAYSVTEGLMPRFVPETGDLGGPVLPPDFFAKAREVTTTGTNKFHYGENASGGDDVFRPGRTFRLSADFETLKRKPGARLSLDFGVYTPALKCLGGAHIRFPDPGTGVRRLSADFSITNGLRHIFRVMLNSCGDAHGKVSNLKLEIVGPDCSVRLAMLEGQSNYQDYMRRWVDIYRGPARDFLMNGRHAKPPRLTCAVQTDEDTAPGRPSVYLRAFTSWDGTRKVLVFANATHRPQRVAWFDGAEHARTLAPLEILLLPQWMRDER